MASFFRRARQAPEVPASPPVTDPQPLPEMPEHMLRWQCLPAARAAHEATVVVQQTTPEQRRERGVFVDALLPELLAELDARVRPHLERLPGVVKPPRATHLRRVRAVVLCYSPDGHRRKHAHTDAADVTLNICLEQARSGGGLFFAPMLNAGRYNRWNMQPLKPGEAMAHSGAIPHGVDDVYNGERKHLVVQYDWFRVAGGEGELPAPAVPGSVDPGLCRGLPARLQIEVASFVGPAALANLCETSRAGYQAFAADALWPQGSRAVFAAAAHKAAKRSFQKAALAIVDDLMEPEYTGSDYYTDEETGEDYYDDEEVPRRPYSPSPGNSSTGSIVPSSPPSSLDSDSPDSPNSPRRELRMERLDWQPDVALALGAALGAVGEGSSSD